MSIKFKGKVGLADPSWAFRFLAKPDETVEEFYKYHPDKNPHQSGFTIAERYVPDLASIYLMMPHDERLRVLHSLHTTCDGSYARYTATTLMGLMLSMPTLTEDEIMYIAEWVDNLTIVHQLSFIEKVFQHPSRDSLVSTFIDKGHDFFISYILLRGTPEEREMAQRTILEHNFGGSLQVLKFAQSNGLITAQDNETELFVNHFRQGNVHSETSRLLKKFKNEVKNALVHTDPVFKGQKTHFDEWCLAVNLLHQKDPINATLIFNKGFAEHTTNNADYNRVHTLISFLNAGAVAFQSQLFLQELRKLFINGDFYDSDYRITQNYTTKVARLFKYAPTVFWDDMRLAFNEIIFSEGINGKRPYYTKNFFFANAIRIIANERHQLNFTIPTDAKLSNRHAESLMMAGLATKNERDMLKLNLHEGAPWKLITPMLEDAPAESELYF